MCSSDLTSVPSNIEPRNTKLRTANRPLKRAVCFFAIANAKPGVSLKGCLTKYDHAVLPLTSPHQPNRRVRRFASALALLVLALAIIGPSSSAWADERAALTRRYAGPSTRDPWPPTAPDLPTSTCSTPLEGKNRTYNVGPGQKYAELTEVPWLSLRAGDVVNIFRRPQPYRTKIGLRAQGSAKLPVVINGVTDAQCNRPEISGQDAVTASDAAHESFFSKQYSEFLGKIGRAHV